MDFIKGKIWLARGKVISKKIWELEIEIEGYRSCLLGSSISYEKVNVIKTPENHLEKIMCQIDECERKLNALKIERGEILLEINNKINELEEGAERLVLRAFYVGNMRMADIAENIGYDEKYCYEIRKRGIEKL